MSESSKAVFLSYASQDAEAAKRICEALRSAGVEVWFDQNELRGGDTWDQQIRQQVKECALFLPVISASTQARREAYFRLEWKLAEDRSHLMARGTPFLVPVSIDATAERGAIVPESFLAVQWTRLTGGVASPEFCARMKALLGPSPAVAPVVPATAAKPGPRPTAAVSEQSVAVLAFANLSNDRDNEYFSDGISEELLNVLAKVPHLKVTARTSAFHFKGKDTPIPEIARQLGVAYVVEGSVRKMGNRVRITAQLIKAADGFHVWSENFDRELQDIFAVQDEIAGLIAQNLQLKLGAGARVGSTVDPEAYRLFLQGRAVVNREIPDDYGKAIRFLKESLAIDESSALTWSWLATAYIMSAAQGMMLVNDGFELARTAAHRAIALDPLLPNGHSALGCVMFAHDWDWDGAERVLQHAANLAPGDSAAVSFLAQVAQATGKTERAIALGRRALELDPLNNLAGYVMGKSYFQAGRFEEMIRLGEDMIGLNPTGFYGCVFQIYGNLLLQRVPAAVRAVEQTPRGFYKLVGLALARHAEGRAAEADAALDELKRVYGVQGAYQIAEVHAFRGERDAAFEWLESAFTSRDPGMTWMINDAFFRNVRSDPRWAAMLRKMKLSVTQHP